jgi:uncharacterized paraquat-inducible protein A
VPDDDEGGDRVCWLSELCPECGAMPTAEPGAEPGRCWRCGHDLRERDRQV